MNRTPMPPVASGHLIIGVDTHKHLHVAAAVDAIAGLQATVTIPNDQSGFADLVEWAAGLGQTVAFGIEGTGSYGQALTRYLHGRGARVVEVNRPDRAVRRRKGKSDAVDAENAARAVLAGFATSEPKSADGSVEAIRRLKVAYDIAVKQRSQTMNTIKSLLVVADQSLKEACVGLTGGKLIDHLARLRPGTPADPDRAARYSIRSLARRWQQLDAEAVDLADQIAALASAAAPGLLELYGIGPDCAAAILVAVGDNPGRIKSEAALAKLAGACPIPAGSGRTAGRHRLNRGGNRAFNAALHRAVLVRLRHQQQTRDYLAKRTAEGKSKRDIIRCLKRYLVREIYQALKSMTDNPLGKTCVP